MIQERFKPSAVMAASRDIVARGAGVATSTPHPIAAEGVSLAELAIACGREANPHRSDWHSLQAMAAGISTSTFPRLLAEGLQALVSRTFTAQAQHMRFATIVPLNKLGTPVDLLGFIDPVVELLPVNELGLIQSFLGPAPARGVPSVRLSTYGRIVKVTREAIINDDLRSIANFLANLGASGARTEAVHVAQALESNPTMDDGTPLFDELLNNVVPSLALDDGSLSHAMAKLRKQRLPNGSLSDLAARHLVVCASMEWTARRLVKDAGLDLEIHPMAYLPDGRWYLLADQEIQPTVGVLRLGGAKDPTRTEQAPKHALKGFDGTGVRVMVDTGATLLSGVGIVRGGSVLEE